ncbi:MAG: glycine--tRNA ligase subunit beta [Helicobacteraceae bacterium]|nr:glycine--tRNA ligase subunit beta [Helicobacteraceae bacterium]
MLQPLLIEIGVEELPAVPLLKELPNIEKKWLAILEKNSLTCEFEFYYTPRRLVLWHSEFKIAQEDSIEELFGAPVAIAYKDGVATNAALGFAKKCGVELSEIGKSEKNGKEVLYYKKEISGLKSEELVPTMIEEFMNSLKFGKSMRWGSLSESFIRPIRWLNVLFGTAQVPMTLFGVNSASTTFVHRMSSFDPVAVSNVSEYFEILKNGNVDLFQDERKARILCDFENLEKFEGITIERDDELLDEVVAITENPTALIGQFDKEFLQLPIEVIIASMKEHQRYFPVYREGKLSNEFIVVSNAVTNDFTKVIAGNEKVLRPRLADGLFFYNNDLKNGLSTKGLEKVVFIDGLGTLSDKIDREMIIAKELLKAYSSFNINEVNLLRAVSLAKADLMSEMVYEFTELQGLMGSYYATALGENESVATAIKEQYLPTGEDSELPSTPLSAIVAMSIKLDTLLGLFSIDQIPTGSRDPFALRRAVNGLVRIVKEHNFEFNISEVLRSLGKNYKQIDFEKLEQFFLERLNQSYNVNPSIIKAVLSSGEREILKIDQKINALNTIVNSEAYSSVSATFKRVANISEGFETISNIDESLFENEHENKLYKEFSSITSKKYATYEENLDALFSMRETLDEFFEHVMVNAEDEKIKNNRKSLVASIYHEIRKIADIKEVSV